MMSTIAEMISNVDMEVMASKYVNRSFCECMRDANRSRCERWLTANFTQSIF